RMTLASGGGTVRAVREGPPIGVSKEEAAEAVAIGHRSGGMPVTSGVFAATSSLNAPGSPSTAGSGIDQPFGHPKDGEMAADQLESLPSLPPTLPSAATGVAAGGAKWERVPSHPGRAGASEPYATGMGQSTIDKGVEMGQTILAE